MIPAREETDGWGGWKRHALHATGRFRIEEWQGGHWFVTPDGHPFIGVGIAHANRYPASSQAPGDRTEQLFGADDAAYVADRSDWMRRAGFNAFSYTTPENESVRFPWVATLPLIPGFINFGPRVFDLYDPAWRASAAATIERELPALLRDPRVIGVGLSYPVLASPHVVPEQMWRRLARKPTNLLRELKGLDGRSAGKRAYVEHLRTRYGTVDAYSAARGAVASFARDFDDLLPVDLGQADRYDELHPDDVEFYSAMWSQAVEFLVAEIRRQSRDVLVFSPRLIGLRQFPDPWLDAWLAGVGPHVDAFLPELYACDDFLGIVEQIGRLTKRPSFVADGMRPGEFNYAVGRAADENEASSYRRMFEGLVGSPWFLGGTVCEYRPRRAEFPWYSLDPDSPRTGVRCADYSERDLLFETYQELHGRKYLARVEALSVPR